MADGAEAFFGRIADRDARAATNFFALRNANPDRAAQANRLSSETGLPADMVERNLDEVAGRQRATRGAALVQSNPALRRWFSNPRRAAASIDDVDTLHAISTILGKPAASSVDLRAPRDVPIAERGAAIRGRNADRLRAIEDARPKSTPGSWWTGTAVGTVEGFRQSWLGGKMYVTDALGFSEYSSEQQDAFQQSLDRAASFVPTDMSRTGQAAFGGVVSLGQMIPALVVGIATGGVGGAALIGAQTGLAAYGKYRTRGGSPNEALLGGVLEGGIETATEIAPLAVLNRAFGKRGAGSFVREFLGKEMLSEQIATLGQDAVDTAIANPNATWKDYLAARPGAAFDTAVAVGIASGALGGVHHAVRALAPVEAEIEHATAAVAGQNMLDTIMGRAAVAPFRERDPGGFRAFVEQQTEGSPVEHVYVPAEKIRELMQSDAFDPRTWDEVAPDIEEQVVQATATGGDVVLPVAGVATHLAGTPAWDALRDDARLSPGGMSKREADAFANDYADLMASRGREAAAAAQAEADERAPERKVYDEVLSQSRQAGFNLRASRAYADLWAQWAASRAARLGTDAWDAFQSAQVSIREEIPDAVAGYRKADQLDVLINAMRRSAEAPKPVGLSLLEWIAQRGGITDAGGDIASMGGAEWHRGKPFRKRLLRPGADASEGNMLGSPRAADGYGLDDTLQAAIAAGYFPELSGGSEIVGGVDAGTFADKPDARLLLDAIESELRGTPVYPATPGIDRVRETDEGLADAATSLRSFLESRGIDADKADRAGIEAALTEGSEKAPRAARSLMQGERGRLDIYADGSKVIRLFGNRDLSTVLHESAHAWLEVLKADAAAPEASEATKADWQVVERWFAANEHPVADGVIPTEAHEMWARSMERYFMEGKAPSSALQSAFASFRAWLLRIYQLATRLDAPLTDEVRTVFDRMLATDDAIADAVMQAEARPLFTSAEQAGMTEQEFAAYRATVTGSRTEAFDALLFRTMESVRRARTAEWKAERATVRDGVAKEIAARPEFVALSRLRGKGAARVALDRAAIVEEYGTDALALVPKGVPPTVAAVGGVHPDVLAEAVGLSTGQDLMARLMGLQQRENDLRAAGDKRSAFNEAVNLRADDIMRERHGDPLADGSIEEEALGAIHNDQRATVLASELRALARRAGQVPTPWEQARDWARRIVREGTIGEQASAAAVARHQRNEVKAGRAAERATLAGDLDAAFNAKQQQQLSAAMFRAAKDAKDEVDRIVKRLGKLARARSLPSMDQEYLDRIHDLLEANDLRRRTTAEVAERESFAAWVKSREEAGEEVHVPQRLRSAGAIHFTKLTYDNLTALDDTVASIAHLGRVKRKLVLAGEERDFEDTVHEFLMDAENLRERSFSADRNRKASKLREFDAVMVKMEFLADQLDRKNPNGIVNRLLVQGATRAANRQAELTERVLAPLARLYLDMPADQRKRLAERVAVPEFLEINQHTLEVAPSVFTRMDLLAVALNTGNESNLDKMIRGESLPFRQMPDFQWTEAKVQAVLDRELTEADWRFVEGVWRQIDSLWPDIVEAERAITGVAPERVEPRMVQTRFGVLQGSYYPIAYDPARSQRAADHYEDDAVKLFGQLGRAVSTPKGHTIERTEYAAPLLLAVEPVLLNHVRRVTSRIAYGSWARDVLKFTNEPRVRRMIDRKLGPEYHRQIAPWLKSQINEAAMNTGDLRGFDRWLRQARVNTTMVGLGFRLKTMVAQVGGLPNSAREIGGKWLLQGMAEAVANVGSVRSFVFSRSAEMQRRAMAFDRDVNAAFRDMEGKNSMLDSVRGMAFWGIGAIDVNLVSIPTWLGAYRRGLSEGMTEEEAAAFGDKSVRRSQGAGRSKDLAAIQNSAEGYRVMTMFYSYFSVLYNQQREAIMDVRDGDYRRAAMTAWWVMMAGPLASAFATGDWPKDEESWPEWAARKVFFGLWAGVPGVRDMANVLERKVSGQFVLPTEAPIYRAFDGLMTVTTAAVKAARGDEVNKRWLRSVIETPGYFLGLPTGQPATTADYLYAVAKGEQRPEDAQDVAAGMLMGRRETQE